MSAIHNISPLDPPTVDRQAMEDAVIDLVVARYLLRRAARSIDEAGARRPHLEALELMEGTDDLRVQLEEWI